MDFNLTEEQLMVQKTAREFRENEIEPIAAEIEKEPRLRDDIIKREAELGFLGMSVPTEYGGGGATSFDHLLVIEEIAYAGSPAWWPVPLITVSLRQSFATARRS